MFIQGIIKVETNLLKGNTQGAKALTVWSYALTIVVTASIIQHTLYAELKAHKGSKIIISTYIMSPGRLNPASMFLTPRG